MLITQAGSSRARSAVRLAVLSLVAALAGCSAPVGTGALEVQVNFEAGLTSRCVKVTARDATLVKETMAISLTGKTSPLKVGVLADGLSSTVTVHAQGYSDEACTTATNEVSEALEASFTSPPTVVMLTLRAAVNGDGGFDGGRPDAGVDAGIDAGVDAGVDAGFDAGVDQDGDGYPLPADCNDTDPNINPGMLESCINGFDDDCDTRADCEQAVCGGFICAGMGRCMGTVCVAMTEVSCTDGVDNNGNNLIDCADPGCAMGTTCNDNNSCSTGDRCVAGGLCQSTGSVMCTNPPAAQCWAATGTCLPDAGASCQYTQIGGSCNDTFACTDNDTCAGGSCAGTPRVCNTPPNSCLQATGTCQEPGGACTYAPRTAGTGTCSDGQNCTINDTCNGAGACQGTAVTCATPNQCQNASTTCYTNGACIYPPRTGLSCDAGTGAGTCDTSFNCNLVPSTLFPTPPSNFAESQLPADAGTAFTVSCATSINTSTQVITSSCITTMPPSVVITQDGGIEPALLIRVPSLTVNSGQVLTITGTRPVIFAVTGNVQIDGIIRANNAGTPSGCGNGGNGGMEGGGGGGGFGTAGAVGGIRSGMNTGGAVGGANGSTALTPLRGGCRGGNGFGTGGTGGAGGGAIQIVASGNLTVGSTGIVTAPGLGGSGATGTDDCGGGGGAGGGILLEATVITLTSGSWLSANGGGGGGGEDNGDGSPGGDGPEASVTPAVGGNGPGMAGNGGTGATRTTAAQAGFATSDNDGAGGGGAGLGRIRLNARTSCSIDGAANRTPNVTSNGASSCP